MTRFRRSKDECSRGLTPAQAQAERAGGTPVQLPKVTEKRKQNGEIVLRICPGKDVDADYFEHLRGKTIEVTQDELFYKWIDHYLDKVYANAGHTKLFQDILDKGIGELINTIHLEKDIK